ncbi:hypothetical protein B0H19DRAFT_1064460 [Mycena capillaripes]|nr:hypothetical protein B0H19DRAFT_1064460 [Mycena capillaripes]
MTNHGMGTYRSLVPQTAEVEIATLRFNALHSVQEQQPSKNHEITVPTSTIDDRNFIARLAKFVYNMLNVFEEKDIIPAVSIWDHAGNPLPLPPIFGYLRYKNMWTAACRHILASFASPSATFLTFFYSLLGVDSLLLLSAEESSATLRLGSIMSTSAYLL